MVHKVDDPARKLAMHNEEAIRGGQPCKQTACKRAAAPMKCRLTNCACVRGGLLWLFGASKMISWKILWQGQPRQVLQATVAHVCALAADQSPQRRHFRAACPLKHRLVDR